MNKITLGVLAAALALSGCAGKYAKFDCSGPVSTAIVSAHVRDGDEDSFLATVSVIPIRCAFVGLEDIPPWTGSGGASIGPDTEEHEARRRARVQAIVEAKWREEARERERARVWLEQSGMFSDVDVER